MQWLSGASPWGLPTRGCNQSHAQPLSPSHSDRVQPRGGEEGGEDLPVHTPEAAAHLVRPPSYLGAAVAAPSSASETKVTHTHQDSQNKTDEREQGLVWMWRNRNPHTLLVGLSKGAATWENSLAVPQKVKQRVTYDPAILLLRMYSEQLEIGT